MYVFCVVLGVLWWSPPHVKGLTLTLNGNSIPTDGSGRILITDINPTNFETDTQALLCQSELTLFEVGIGHWYLHPTQQSTEEEDRIISTFSVADRGWSRTRMSGTYRHVILKRSETAVEGVFTCNITGDRNTPVSVGIYYPMMSVSASIQVVSRRHGLFRVSCTSTGGRALSMSVTGPGGFNSDLNSIEAVGDPQGMGDDVFSASTDVISGGRDEDIYQCTASNGVSPALNHIVELRVASSPTITSLEEISATAVRVEWSQPSGGATVTGYVVHYSDGDTDRNESVAASSTSYGITDLTSGLTYTISVEATSEHLSGVSDNRTVTLVPALPAPQSISVGDVESTSVRVSWQAVEDADRYTVTLSQTMGDDQLGLCREDSHTVSVDTSSLSVVVGQTDGDMLRAYTTYSITVVAESDVLGNSQPSESIIIMSKQTSATVSPHNVRASVVSSAVISVQWDGLSPCSQVNGVIVEYRVQYTAESSGVVQSIDQAGEWNVTSAEASLTELTPYTNYSIHVAAVNTQGDIGLYSKPIRVQTAEDVPGHVVVTPCPSLIQVAITWNPPDLPNGVIIAYEVSYRPTDSSQPVIRLNTTDVATSFTTQSDLEVGTEFIFSVRAYTRVGPGTTASVTVSTLSRPPAVQGVEVVAVCDSVIISWDALIIPHLLIDHYTVVYGQVSQPQEKTSSVYPPATHSVISDLNAKVVYRFQVFATVRENGRTLDGKRSTQVELVTNDDSLSSSSESSSEGVAPIIIGTVIAAIGLFISAVVGILIAIRTKRLISKDKAGVCTEDNPAYGISCINKIHSITQPSQVTPQEPVYEGIF